VTLREVAAQAGVSHQTVSEVVNGSAKVAPNTQARVLAAMAKLDYHPNHAARSMRLSRSFNVAYVAEKPTELADDAMSLILVSLLETLQAAGYNLVLRTISSDRQDQLEELRGALVQGRIDGVIFGAIPSSPAVLSMAAWKHPMVFFDQPTLGDGVATIWVQYRDGIKQAVEHLAAGGRKRIAFIGGPMESKLKILHNLERYGGYRDGLEAVNLKYNKNLVVASDYTINGGRMAARSLLKLHSRPDAIVAASDRMAFGALQEIKAHGLEVPGDIALTGFDDFELSQSADPPLTTVHFPVDELACQAARLLIARIEGKTAPSHVPIAVKLVIRGST
jgi:DNA-binding LacI/PurR family transcriptional regulator